MKLRRGITLVELTVSIVILSLAVIPIIKIFSMLPIDRTNVNIKGNVLYLSKLKTEQLENLFEEDFDVSPSSDGDFSSTAPNIPNSSKYRYHITINSEISGYLKDLSIQVYYDKNGNGSYDAGEDQITIYTKVAKHNDK